jgi:hypothetical protein
LLRLRAGERFARGPWHLGRWSKPIGIIAVVWVALITILFVLPQVHPITLLNFNYAIVAVAAVVLFSGGWWLLSARTWFIGPRVQGTPEELAAIERELGGRWRTGDSHSAAIVAGKTGSLMRPPSRMRRCHGGGTSCCLA